MLGDYAAEVLSAYAISAILLGGLIWVSLSRSRSVKTRLKKAESDHAET